MQNTEFFSFLVPGWCSVHHYAKGVFIVRLYSHSHSSAHLGPRNNLCFWFLVLFASKTVFIIFWTSSLNSTSYKWASPISLALLAFHLAHGKTDSRTTLLLFSVNGSHLLTKKSFFWVLFYSEWDTVVSTGSNLQTQMLPKHVQKFGFVLPAFTDVLPRGIWSVSTFCIQFFLNFIFFEWFCFNTTTQFKRWFIFLW